MPQPVQMSNGDLAQSLVLAFAKQGVLTLEYGHSRLTGQPLAVAVQFSQQQLIIPGVLAGKRVPLVGPNAYVATTAKLSDEPGQL